MNSAFKSTLFHSLEVAGCMVFAGLVTAFGHGVLSRFGISSVESDAFITFVTSAALKFARTSDAIPVPDYVAGE